MDSLDGSKVIPSDQLNAKLFYNTHSKNEATTKLVHKMVVEVIKCLLVNNFEILERTHLFTS